MQKPKTFNNLEKRLPLQKKDFKALIHSFISLLCTISAQNLVSLGTKLWLRVCMAAGT